MSLCIFHGKEDNLIFYNEAKKLFDKCINNNKKELYLIENMGHNNVLFFREEMYELAEKFINKYCPFDKNKDNISLDLDKGFFNYISDDNDDFNRNDDMR